MSSLLALCRTADVMPDTPRQARLGGQDVAVFAYEGAYYVTQDLCTHGPGCMSDGYVEGCEVECPFHQGRFNFITGEPTAAPCVDPLRVWKVTVRDGTVFVDPGEHAPA
jgi:nitrite reductase/ring-hydroxylating ferredoxin subunit